MGKEQRFLELYDGFEEDELSDIWSHKKFEEGTVIIQNKIVRKGKNAAKITVNKGNIAMQGSRNITERTELLEKKVYGPCEDEIYKYCFSMYIPKNFPIVPTRLVLAQWKQRDIEEKALINNPIIAIRYEKGMLFITKKTNEKRKTLFTTKKDIKGKWTDWEFQLKFTRTKKGIIKVWMNNNKIIDYKGTTAYSEKFNYPKQGHFFFKIGLYRDTMNKPMSIYIDEYKKTPIKNKQK